MKTIKQTMLNNNSAHKSVELQSRSPDASKPNKSKYHKIED